MIITIETMRAAGACIDGLADFAREFPGGLDTGGEWTAAHQIGALMSPLRRWLGWAWPSGIIPSWSMAGWVLTRANLTRANLDGAYLAGADLAGAARLEADLPIPGWVLQDGRLVRE